MNCGNWKETMSKVVCGMTPLVYLHRINGLHWLPQMFDEVLVSSDVLEELQAAIFIGFDVPHLLDIEWIQFSDPQLTIPMAWLSIDMSKGDLLITSLALENQPCILLLDDGVARKAARLAGLTVWGTLSILLEAKQRELIPDIANYVDRFDRAGMWVSSDIRRRILRLSGETVDKELTVGD
jgi:predicted nucleic acid-binding protein